MAITNEDLEHRFTFHPAAVGSNTAEKHQLVRDECLNLALELATICPTSRELSLAITNLEQVMFWANAAVARNS